MPVPTSSSLLRRILCAKARGAVEQTASALCVAQHALAAADSYLAAAIAAPRSHDTPHHRLPPAGIDAPPLAEGRPPKTRKARRNERRAARGTGINACATDAAIRASLAVIDANRALVEALLLVMDAGAVIDAALADEIIKYEENAAVGQAFLPVPKEPT